MCGIYFRAATAAATALRIDADLYRRLRNRGPDHFSTIATSCGPWELAFTSTVLALRGETIATQPLEDKASGSVLCWNGEAWRIGGRLVQGNDATELLGMLAGRTGEETVLDILQSIEGPFAFVFLDRPAAKVYYGRDRLGRRSLLANSSNSGLKLSSIAESADASWVEVGADGLYCADLSECSSSIRSMRYAWMGSANDKIISGIGAFNDKLPPDTRETSSGAREAGAVRSLHDNLTESLRLRVLGVPEHPSDGDHGAARIAILFSGGLDCTLIARICHDLMPVDQGVDLLNVAFENPRLAAAQRSDDCSVEDKLEELYEACPDRITGRKSFVELCQACPGRNWRLVMINVPYAETTAHRAEIVSLMHPQNTEMDLSIAVALYFAARGQGRCRSVSNEDDGTAGELVSTPSRVLLSGLGADELFGGYTRHAAAFARRGHAGLVEELRLDVARLGRRNLGRDDRVMASWGREVRFPFLDERLVRWAMALPTWQKCDFASANEGDDTALEPGKRLLRLLARQLGLEGVAREKKRAIQFGSRAAKMTSGKVKGTTLIT